MNLPTPSPRVMVVILYWQRPLDTRACLESLGRLDYPSFEVVVVDNSATKGARDLIREQFPNVVLVDASNNLGFAGGSNLGIAEALRRGADYVFLLNDDTEVAPSALTTLVQAGESDPRIGVIGPTICYFDHPNLVWFGGGRVGKEGQATHLRGDQVVGESSEGLQDVDYVTGCAMLVKRKVVERVGVLDERFFAYFEETEWCARARRAGFRVVHVPRTLVWHKVSPEQRGHSPFYLYLMARNRLLYLRCGRAGTIVIGKAILDLLRTAVSWRLRPKHAQMRPCSSALILGIRDFLVGRFGAPPVQISRRG